MKNEEFICSNLGIQGEMLTFAGVEVKKLADKYGTPLYLFDEDRIRERCRTYKNAMSKAFGEKGQTLFASKAASFAKIYTIMKSEGMGIDVVSCGEIYTAMKAGFPLEKAYFHGNNKTDADIAFAMKNGVGTFVADNEEELYAINRIAGEMGIRQKTLLRITPGVDPHTYAAISTGKVDSKFGNAIETGAAERVTRIALGLENVDLRGFHSHVGSQVFDSDVYLRCAQIMLDFIAIVKVKLGYEAKELDLGGGYGVRYLSSHPVIDIEANIMSVADFIKKKCDELDLELPIVSLEPGRSIVADAGMTVYTAGTVKRIPGYKNYVSVDGSMGDNPRYALYGAPYTVLPATKMTEERTMQATVAGRCCESGDIIQENVPLPESMKRGDLLAVLTTGAYNYSMASNYNRLPRPPIVMLSDCKDEIAVRRETFEYLTELDNI